MLDESYLEPYNGQTLPYDADKKRLQEMLAGSQVSPSTYQIPLTITIERWTGEASISAIQKFFDVVALCWNVKTAVHSGRLLMRRRGAYHLKDVYVEACHGTREEVARLEACGVSITGATNAHFMSHETVHSIVGVNSWSRLKALEINATSHEELARLYSALSCGQHIGALSVRFRVTENLGALAQVLLRTAGNCAALHRLHIDMGHEPLDLVACEALGKAVDVALRGPRRQARMLQKVHKNMVKGDVLPLLCGSGYSKKVLVVLSDGNAIEVVSSAVEAFDEPTSECLSSPIETFSLRAKAADELAAMAITKLVQRCLPQSLKVLTLDVATFDDACLELILESFPQLQTLRIKDARVRTADPLVAACKDHGCKIRALELGAYGLDVTELLRALGDPSSRIVKTLKQLQLNCPYDDEPRETFLAAVKTMLSLNDTLEFVKLSKLRDDRAEVSEQLRPFREVVLPTRSKLALLSAVHAAASTDSMLGAMDCQIVNLIMRMAETPRLRVVCVE